MNLFAVVVTSVYPNQCITVWDRRESALKLRDHLNERFPGEQVGVRCVDSFFPSGMTDADPAWLKATDSYLRGNHHNTTD